MFPGKGVITNFNELDVPDLPVQINSQYIGKSIQVPDFLHVQTVTQRIENHACVQKKNQEGIQILKTLIETARECFKRGGGFANSIGTLIY